MVLQVQKAFYSLIHERRIGEYHLPKGSIVIGAGNRTQDVIASLNICQERGVEYGSSVFGGSENR